MWWIFSKLCSLFSDSCKCLSINGLVPLHFKVLSLHWHNSVINTLPPFTETFVHVCDSCTLYNVRTHLSFIHFRVKNMKDPIASRTVCKHKHKQNMTFAPITMVNIKICHMPVTRMTIVLMTTLSVSQFWALVTFSINITHHLLFSCHAMSLTKLYIHWHCLNSHTYVWYYVSDVTSLTE